MFCQIGGCVAEFISMMVALGTPQQIGYPDVHPAVTDPVFKEQGIMGWRGVDGREFMGSRTMNRA